MSTNNNLNNTNFVENDHNTLPPQYNYTTFSDLVQYKDNKQEGPFDYLKILLEKVQKLSLFIKKLKLVEDPKYLEGQNKEYANLLKACKIKIEKIILKTIQYVSKDNSSSGIGNKNKLGETESQINFKE